MKTIHKILPAIFENHTTLPQQLRQSITLWVGNVLKITLGLGTSILLLRGLGPEQTGRMALVLNVISLFAIIGEFGLRDAALNYLARFRHRDPNQAATLARAFFFAKLFLSLSATTLALLGASWIANYFYQTSSITHLLYFAAFTLLTNGLLGYSMVLLEAQQRFALISKLNSIQAIIRLALIATLFLSKKLTLPIYFMLEASLPFFVFLYTLWKPPFPFLKSTGPLEPAWKLLFDFTKWHAISTLFATVLARLDILILSYFHPSFAVGLYAATQTVITRFNFVKGPILTTAFAEACRRTTISELRAFIRESLIMTGGITLLFLPALFWGDYLISLLFGTSYAQDKSTFIALLISFLISLNIEPISYVLFPLNKARLIALRNFVQLLITSLIGLWLIPTYGGIGAALTVLTKTLVFTFLNAGLIYWYLSQSPDKEIVIQTNYPQ